MGFSNFLLAEIHNLIDGLLPHVPKIYPSFEKQTFFKFDVCVSTSGSSIYLAVSISQNLILYSSFVEINNFPSGDIAIDLI